MGFLNDDHLPLIAPLRNSLHMQEVGGVSVPGCIILMNEALLQMPGWGQGLLINADQVPTAINSRFFHLQEDLMCSFELWLKFEFIE